MALVVVLSRANKGRSPVLCCVVAGIIFTTLFPVISASDDVIRIQHLDGSHGSQRGRETDSHRSTNDNLIRLFEAMESPLAATPVRILFTLIFAFLTVRLCNSYARQCTIAQSGRSPPLFLA